MNVVVCVKQTPSSEARVRVAPDGRSIDRERVELALNPYDEFAFEEALKAKEKFGGSLIALTVGPQKAEEALRHCLALGADRAVIVKDETLLGGDPFGTARVLAAALRTLEPDLVFCGKVSIDVENHGTGTAVAELLGLPHVTAVSKLAWTDESRCTVHREIEGASEEFEVVLPAVLTAEKGLNEPRYPKLPGIMKAKKKPIEDLDAAALGISAGEAGPEAARFEVTAMEPPPPRAEGKKIEGEPAAAVRQVLDALRNERKLI